MRLSRRYFLTKLSHVTAAGYVTFLWPRRPALSYVSDSAPAIPRGRYLVVNADDFGADDDINRGVIEAHEHGIVTSASLMVNMPGAQSAARLAKDHPNLSLGLHVNFTAGERVVDLRDGRALQRELERQFDAFRDMTGDVPTHLDSHQHVHRQFNIRRPFLELSHRYRIPLRGSSEVTYIGTFYGQWEDGHTDLRHISLEYLVSVLNNVKPGFSELACHPGTQGGHFDAVYNWQREIEVQSLTDPRAKVAATRAEIQLTSYRHYRSPLTPSTARIAEPPGYLESVHRFV
jgi:predicted glycoside hydrolase/deacetylase ChbG (UPF0249 family)